MNFNTKIDQNQATLFEHDEMIYFAVGNQYFDKVGRFKTTEGNECELIEPKKWK